ncbi:MAG: hypothetical protein KDA37_06635, partial [Planctomycetales bacterium]|nr:hypothetical protein [Planctomycetales bacterium]
MNNRTRITRSPSARRLLILAGCCAAFLCLTAPLSAASVLDTSGFEGYFSGPLPGQLEGNLPWKTIGSGGGSAWVETTSGVNNTHGVRVDRAANSNDWWAVSYSGQGLPNSRFLFIDWD